jgi:quercetin dioxygenase-like cupin family protein
MEGLFLGIDNKFIEQVRGTSILSLLAKTGDLEIMLYEFAANRPNSITPGDSPDLLEFYYILEGSIVIDVKDGHHELHKGDYFYVHISQTSYRFVL